MPRQVTRTARTSAGRVLTLQSYSRWVVLNPKTLFEGSVSEDSPLRPQGHSADSASMTDRFLLIKGAKTRPFWTAFSVKDENMSTGDNWASHPSPLHVWKCRTSM